jgi:hypothetical protein
MVVLEGNFAVGWGPGMDYPWKHIFQCMLEQTDAINERGSRTNYIHSSIPHYRLSQLMSCLALLSPWFLKGLFSFLLPWCWNTHCFPSLPTEGKFFTFPLTLEKFPISGPVVATSQWWSCIPFPLALPSTTFWGPLIYKQLLSQPGSLLSWKWRQFFPPKIVPHVSNYAIS